MHRFLKKWYQMYGQQNPSNQRNIFFIETCSIDSIHLQNDTVFAFLISQAKRILIISAVLELILIKRIANL